MASLPQSLSKAPVGRRRLPRQVVETHQRERILDASIPVFAKRGYQATTIDHIVAAARIGVGSFYALFAGKEDCFIQAYDRVVALARERVAAATPAAGSWAEQTAAGLRALLALIAAEPHSARLALVEVQTAGATALARYGETLESLTPWLRRGRELSSVGAELPATLEDATVTGLAWLLHQRLVTGGVGDIEALFPDLAGILLEPYLGEAETQSLIAAPLTAS